MTFKEYQEKSYKNIQPHQDQKDEVLNWAVGLTEEVGEVMNKVKHQCWGNETVNKQELAKELGDVLWYLSAFCKANKLDLETIAELNYQKLEFRFGDSFTEEKSKARHENEMKFSETEMYKHLIEKLELE